MSQSAIALQHQIKVTSYLASLPEAPETDVFGRFNQNNKIATSINLHSGFECNAPIINSVYSSFLKMFQAT